MLPFQERKKLRKIMYAKTSIFVLFVFVVLVARGAWSISQKAAIARAERDDALRALDEAQKRNGALAESLARLKSVQGIEQEIRQKFSVAGANEEVVVVVDENAKKGKNGNEAQTPSLWQRFISLFK